MVQSFLIIGARAFQIKRRKKEILKCETQELLRINSGLTDRTGIQEFQELIQTVLEETDQTLDSNLTWNAFETLMLSLSALSVFVEAFRNVFSTCETLVSFFFRHQFSRWTRKQGEFHRPHMILQVWPCTHKQWETRFSPYSGSNGTNAFALNRAAPVSRCVPPLFSSQPWMFPFWCWRSSSCCIVRAHFTARCDLCLCDRSVNVDRQGVTRGHHVQTTVLCQTCRYGKGRSTLLSPFGSLLYGNTRCEVIGTLDRYPRGTSKSPIIPRPHNNDHHFHSSQVPEIQMLECCFIHGQTPSDRLNNNAIEILNLYLCHAAKHLSGRLEWLIRKLVTKSELTRPPTGPVQRGSN